MSRRIWFTFLLFLGMAAIIASCGAEPAAPATSTPETNTPNMPNPASVFCEENGGTIDIREDAAGGQVGICVFPDGSECDEWAYYRGECQPQSATVPPESLTPPNMANPASIFCEENGGQVDIREDAAGGQVGICVFPDGSECDEWAYFRGECQPEGATLATPTAELAEDGWKIYRNDTLGYTFHYPADAIIEFADDPNRTLTIVGPMVDDEHWPMIMVNHPGDRDDYRPPEGVDLVQWLTDQNLLVNARLADRQIAGTVAVHTRLDRSPQSYAFDTFTFAHAGQLYSIVILHTGDKEDWSLYDRFLDSFTFTMEPTSAVPANERDAIMSLSQADVYSVAPSPDGQWQARVTRYNCVQVNEGDMMAYETLSLVEVATGSERRIDEQLQSCGGMGAYGLNVLFWSPNGRFLYYTDAREGGPDGCGYWERPILRYDLVDQASTQLGGGPISPGGTRLATWQKSDLAIWDVDAGEVGRIAQAGATGIGPIVWSPDSQSLAYARIESFCPLSGMSTVTRLDMADLQPQLLLQSDSPTFGALLWTEPGYLRLFDANGAEWRYNLATAELTPGP